MGPFERLKHLLMDLAKVTVKGFNIVTIIIFTALLLFLALLSGIYKIFLPS